MAWPRPAKARAGEQTEDPVGIASSAAGEGLGGAATPLLAWCGYWSLAAVLFLLPDNRTATSVSSAITGMSSGEPSAYAHFLTSFGNQFGHGGIGTTWLLAIASLIVGFGPLVVRRPSPFLCSVGSWPDSSGSAAKAWAGSSPGPDRSEHRTDHRALGLRHGAGRPA